MDGLLNKQFLEGIGVSLDEATQAALSEHYEETLNERVVAEIVDELDEGQLEELHALKNKSAEELNNWLTKNVAQLDEIIEDEVAILLGELAENNEKIA